MGPEMFWLEVYLGKGKIILGFMYPDGGYRSLVGEYRYRTQWLRDFAPMIKGEWVSPNSVPTRSIVSINRFLARLKSEVGSDFRLERRIIRRLEGRPLVQIGLVGG